MAGVVLIISLLILMVIGLPIAFSLGVSSFLALLIDGSISFQVVTQRLFAAADSFSYLAIPFFVLTGQLMQSGGMSHRLVNFADNLLGWMNGGLAQVSIAAATFFAAISGSSAATTAAVGGVLYPEMYKRNYNPDFSATVQAVGGTLGVVIPPSIPLIVYGIQTGTSVGTLFLAGIIPGIIGAMAYMAVSFGISKKRGYPVREFPTLSGLFNAFKDALWGLLTPVIILGGIYSGIFTPTESAVVAVVYALLIGRFVYKELDGSTLYQVFSKSAMTSAMVMFLIVTASLFGWIMTIENIPHNVGEAVMGFADNPIIFLLLANLVFLLFGMFLDTVAILLILTPIFSPIAFQLGIDPVHFGVLMVFNLAVGQMTPPFGVTLFVSSGISERPIENIFKSVVPFLVTAMILILVFSYVPLLFL